ncbi:Holliday junction resolvase RuvX [Croceivirga thetidis]|uniref:Putative pre-16S rRNA nuclease n=1 Tax=Croceivirga thetidis TaxID=2721623 RepID=A0ABX1GTG7_9FLAO|nr:Holliday junction resolvase RuvX [Croceivirga thetidis]NKI32909.1 Holliday junction resolvase RuvX [Croceivirga thetidis]
MGRIIGLDFGMRRTGVAVTDELQMIASPLRTIETENLIQFLKDYIATENVVLLVIGEPKQMDGSPSESEKLIEPLIQKLKNEFESIAIERQDERFTSKMAVKAMIAGGMKKKKRQVKGEIDKISATLILQSYLDRK